MSSVLEIVLNDDGTMILNPLYDEESDMIDTVMFAGLYTVLPELLSDEQFLSHCLEEGQKKVKEMAAEEVIH